MRLRTPSSRSGRWPLLTFLLVVDASIGVSCTGGAVRERVTIEACTEWNKPLCNGALTCTEGGAISESALPDPFTGYMAAAMWVRFVTRPAGVELMETGYYSSGVVHVTATDQGFRVTTKAGSTVFQDFVFSTTITTGNFLPLAVEVRPDGIALFYDGKTLQATINKNDTPPSSGTTGASVGLCRGSGITLIDDVRIWIGRVALGQAATFMLSSCCTQQTTPPLPMVEWGCDEPHGNATTPCDPVHGAVRLVSVSRVGTGSDSCSRFEGVYDCAGEPYGTLVYDRCGLCGGNGGTCLDCMGIPYGTAQYDLNGVCGGRAEISARDATTASIGAVAVIGVVAVGLTKYVDFRASRDGGATREL